MIRVRRSKSMKIGRRHMNETELWGSFLDSNFCLEEWSTGNRPCDSGVICDKCHTDRARADFENFKETIKNDIVYIHRGVVVRCKS